MGFDEIALLEALTGHTGGATVALWYPHPLDMHASLDQLQSVLVEHGFKIERNRGALRLRDNGSVILFYHKAQFGDALSAEWDYFEVFGASKFQTREIDALKTRLSGWEKAKCKIHYTKAASAI